MSGLLTQARRWWPLAATALAALIAGPVEFVQTGSWLETSQALAAVALAGAVWYLAAGLPGVTASGLALGGFFVAGGALSWTYGKAVWGLLLVGGVAFLVWTKPLRGLRSRYLRPISRLGGGWLGVSYWIFAVLGALLVARPAIAAQRLLYAGVFTLAGFAVIASVRQRRTGEPAAESRRTGQGEHDRPDPSIGVAAAFLIMIALLLAAGSGNLFDPTHVVVEGPWGAAQDRRFWGGPALLYHPNSLAGIATFAAIRIGADARFAAGQRALVTVLAGYVVFVTNSRTGFVVLGAAAGLHAAGLLLARHGRLVRFSGLPRYQGARFWTALALPFVVLTLIIVASGGRGFIVKQRYGDAGGLTSGRTETWRAVGHEWRVGGIAEKLFGDTRTVRAVVRRPSAGDVDLTTDNAAVGALRRGGVFGVLGFGLGLWLLVSHALRRRSPSWFVIAVGAALPTIAVADWLLGGTGGTVWILLLAGEASLIGWSAESGSSTGSTAAASAVDNTVRS